jgi:hypothetical protein
MSDRKKRTSIGARPFLMLDEADLPEATRHVVEKLVGIKGTTVEEVVSFALTQWAGEHAEELSRYGISVTRIQGTFVVSRKVRRQLQGRKRGVEGR